MNQNAAAAHILITGRVQGVGFRFFAQDAAAVLGLKGWVRNLPGGGVECEVEGPRGVIESYLIELRKGPPVSRVEAVNVDWIPPSGRWTEFEIRG